jgi:hypothetical protein
MSTTKVKSKQQLAITANLDFGSTYTGINVITPTNPGDIANKGYVDAVKQALDIKDSARLATTGGETYTIATGAVTQITGTSIDGVTAVVGDRILVKNAPATSGAGAGSGTANTTQPANGVYIVTNATTNLTIQRSIDADVNADVTSGLYLFVSEGTAAAGKGYVLITPDPIVLNTTGLTFTIFNGAGTYTASNGILLTGSNFTAVTANSARITIGVSGIDLATVTPAGTATNAIKRLDYDAYGRISGQQNAVLADIITTIGSGLTANTVFAAPSGSGGSPSFRALVALDIPSLSGTIITSGVVGTTFGGTGLNASTATNGQLFIGSSTGSFVLATLTPGTAIGITNAAGSITINNTGVTSAIGTTNQVNVSAATGAVTFSLPQNIHTAATPTFAGVILTGGTVAVSTLLVNATQTWNAGAVTFNAELINITDTASATASSFVSYQIAGTPKWVIRKDGAVTTGIWNGTIITAPFGGTGFGTYAVGDILYADTTTSLAKLADIATGNVLLSGGVSTAPSWGKVSLTAAISGILPIANGGTNSSTALSGSSIMVSNGTSIIQGGAGTSTQVLHGNAAGVPTYGAVVLTTDVSGILPVGNGGTGISTTPTNGQIPIGNGTNYVAAAITGSATINVANAAGSITLSVVTGSTGVMTAANFIIEEVPTGTVDGTNPTFTLANTPLTGSQRVFVNGIRNKAGAGNDYTISGSTITFLTGAIPQTGDTIIVDYLK